MAISYAGQWGVLAMLALAFGRTASAETAFTPPERYPVDRYESEWNKNPFTLKTAPIAVTKASFAENLAIGSYYGSKDKPTVTVVNTKTGERTRLQLRGGENGGRGRDAARGRHVPPAGVLASPAARRRHG